MRATQLARAIETYYPDSDGKPMADNTIQFKWIMTIVGELDNLFSDESNVFVAGDLLWYPVKGNPKIRRAPDAMVIFGRPKGDRGSYKQWEEGNIAPQCVFEIWSSGNRPGEMNQKFGFYEYYGVEEYYLYDPETGFLSGWIRTGETLSPILQMHGWKSPRLGIRFELEGKTLSLYRPDGRRFVSYIEQAQRAEVAEQRAETAEAEVARLKALLENKKNNL